ncbi:MAG: DUF1778 domain-containing protein [Komarekiella atlantica HA4396-MV6]|nr:DUF1778 domain-containing protein [Komarekiella atlantica HA4396-MV6]
MIDEEKFQQFVEYLDAPPSAKENLRKLLITSSLWD